MTRADATEIRMQIDGNILQGIAHKIALSLVEDYREDILTEIKKHLSASVHSELEKVKREIKEEITASIRLSNELRTQQEIKQKLKKEIKDELHPVAVTMVTDKISSSVSAEIKAAVKKHFSQELLEEYKNEMVLYFINDLKRSLKTIAPEIKPVVIDKTYEMVHDEPLPKELSLMTNIYRYRLNSVKMSAPSGVYFLYKEKELQYIGQATYVSERMSAHIGDKDFDEAYFIPVPIDRLDHVETYLITLYKPPLNKSAGQIKYRDLTNIPSYIYLSSNA